MSSLPKIPPEICLEIFSWILLDGRPSSLSPFCRVSRYYQAEAQRLLYRTVDLRGCNMRQVRSWCLAVTRRTHLAHRVYALFLSLPFDLEASDSGKIGCALNRCVNLKDLRMLHPPTANPNRPLSLAESNKSKAWGLLHKRPFRLAKFTDTYFDGWGSGFSETQSEIRLLSIPKSHTFPVEGWQRPLTCLVALEARPQAIPRTGSLKHVQVHLHDLSRDWSRDLHALDSLRHHMSLQTLSFVRHGNKNVSTFDIVDRVADILPDLRHLSISEPKETANLNSIPREEGSLVSALQRFTGIESFVLQVRNSRTVHFKDESSTLHDMGSSEGVFALGLEIMEQPCVRWRSNAPEILSARYNTFKWNATDDFYNSLATYGSA